jgi:hypothetical protein
MAQSEELPAFFTRVGDQLAPGAHARGPWSETMLHGRLLGGLMAWAIEREHAEEDLHFARFTVDLYRNSPLIPLRIETTRVRHGRRIRVVDAAITGENGPVARASAVLLRRGGQPDGAVWSAPVWDVPGPETMGAAPSRGWASFDMWPVGPDGKVAEGFAVGDRHRAWLRETHPLVAGEPLSPLVRVVLAADMASPIAHFGSAGLQYINADFSLNLSRLPLGDTIGIESAGHLSDEGIAVGQCVMYDTSGPIGFCATAAVANNPM